MGHEFNSIPQTEKAKLWPRIHNAQGILSAGDFPGHVLTVFYGKIALWEIWDLIEGKNKLMYLFCYMLRSAIMSQDCSMEK